jgi:hypothetical protein
MLTTVMITMRHTDAATGRFIANDLQLDVTVAALLIDDCISVKPDLADSSSLLIVASCRLRRRRIHFNRQSHSGSFNRSVACDS